MNKSAYARSLGIVVGFLAGFSQLAMGETVTYDVHLYDKRTCIDATPCESEAISRDIEVTAEVPETLPPPFVAAGPESTDFGSHVFTSAFVTRTHPTIVSLLSPLTPELLALKTRQGSPVSPRSVIQSDEYFFEYPDGVEDNGGARAEIEVNQNMELEEEGTCCTDYSSWQFMEILSLTAMIPLGSAGDVEQMSDAETVALLHGANGATLTFRHGVLDLNSQYVNGVFQEGPAINTTYWGTATVRPSGAYTLKPVALGFGDQAVNANSPAKSFTLTNTGSAAMAIGSIHILGVNRTMFNATNDCGASLAAHASCTIGVTFRPTSQGAKAAILRVVAGNNVVRNRPLTGRGVAATPDFSLSRHQIAFDGQRLGTSSAPRIVTLTNTGGVPLRIQSVANQGGNAGMFPVVNSCANPVPAGASCKISIRFRPTSNGAKGTILRVVGANGAPMRSVTLAGTGISPL